MVRLKLDKYLTSCGISRYALAKRANVQYHIVDNYYKNEVVRYDSDVLNRFCTALECEITDLIEYVKD